MTKQGSSRRIRSATPILAALALTAGVSSTPAAAQQAAPAEPIGTVITAADAVVELPIDYVDGRILVPVSMDGVGERLFILDTAAGGSVISTRLRDLLAPTPDQLRQDTVVGASGRRVMEFIQLEDLRLGERSHSDVRAVIADISEFGEEDGRPIDGILGVNVLLAYDVEIDIPGGRLRLHPHGSSAPAWARNSRAIPFHSTAQPGFIQFRAAVAGNDVEAVLDTGARRSILNWHAAALLDIRPESDGVREKADGSRGIDGQGTATHWAPVSGLRIGDTPIPDGEKKIADLPVFTVMDIDHGPVLLVGAQLLEQCALWVSYSARELRLCPPHPGS